MKYIPGMSIIAAIAIAGCGHDQGKPAAGNPLAIAYCPERLSVLTDDSFGATASKLVEVAGIYHKCRAAAIGKKD